MERKSQRKEKSPWVWFVMCFHDLCSWFLSLTFLGGSCPWLCVSIFGLCVYVLFCRCICVHDLCAYICAFCVCEWFVCYVCVHDGVVRFVYVRARVGGGGVVW